MLFPELSITLLIYLALTFTGVGSILLIILFIKDLRKNNIW